jgi:signal transduction histidine kinase
MSDEAPATTSRVVSVDWRAWILLTSVLALFGVVVLDVHRELALLGRAEAWAVLAVAFALLVVSWRVRSFPSRISAVVLLVGILVTLGVGNVELGTLLSRSVEQWRGIQDERGRALAALASEHFADLCSRMRASARNIVGNDAIAGAVGGADSEDSISRAFAELARVDLPRAHERGVSGATLYDANRRPVAWTGANVSLESEFRRRDVGRRSEIFVVQHGVHTHLVAVEPLSNGFGFVSVEVPLSAERGIENRYLEDYSALTSWVGRDLETRYITFGDQAVEIRRLFETRGDPFWIDTEEGRRLYFGLRADDGDLLAISSMPGDPPAVARLESRRQLRAFAAVVLSLAALLALVSFGLERPRGLAFVGAIWAMRLVPLYTDFPLGMGLDLDNPAHYASSLLFDLSRSPADFLLTSFAILATAIIATRWLRSREADGARPDPPASYVRSISASVVVFLLVFGATQILLDAWLNSSLAISTISLVPFDAPRITVQLALLWLFVSAGLFGCLAYRLAAPPPRSLRDVFWLLSSDAAVLLIGGALLGAAGFSDTAWLIVFPVLLIHAVALISNRQVEAMRPVSLYRRLRTDFLLILLPVLSFYPAMTRYGDRTIDTFVESRVAPIVLQHGSTRLQVLSETTRSIDRLERLGRLYDLDRPDLAYHLWVSTALSTSYLSSSIEIVDSDGVVVSRFALSVPTGELDTEREPAPDEWIVEDEYLKSDPHHPGFLLVRRSLLGPDQKRWEIRVRAAADWRNLPFVATTDPFMHLFRTTGLEEPLRFPHRELELFVFQRDGTAVFQSVGGALQPDEATMRRAATSPLWWEHRHEGEIHKTYLFADSKYVYALSYPQKPALSTAAELAGWALLASAVGVLVLLLSILLGAFGSPLGVSPRALVEGLGGSFAARLYVAFVLLALLPIVSLSFLIRGIVIQQLETDAEQEGVARAQVVERFLNDFIVYRRGGGTARSTDDEAIISDAVLEWVGGLATVDVDLFRGGELVATSKPEMFGSGLLKSRLVPEAYLDIVRRRLSHSIHRESVGSLEYLVVSVPIAFESGQEPGVLSLPLASRQPEIDRRVSSLNQAVLLAAMCFSLAAAVLAYTLAKRIAGPINTLTDATHRIAEGDLEVSLHPTSTDEIGKLLRSFIQMTSELKQQRIDLEKTKKLEAWAEMARQVAHEIKNPLTPIQLSTEHLLRVYRDPDVDFDKVLDECTETILQQVKSLRQISMEFSTFASPEPLKLESMDLGDLVRETMEPYIQAPPTGLAFDVQVDAALPMVRGDRRLVKRTLVNLVENALHAVNGGGTVEVRVEPESYNGTRFVSVSVSDTGDGVDPEIKERIFEPYFSTKASGTGLGLAIAKKVVEDHGGRISLESEPGKGTKVTLTLPLSTS